MRVRYVVTGMTCHHCVAHVTEEVSSLPGVSAVEVSLDDASMVVESSDPIEFSAITQAVAEAGEYTVAHATS
ncbi:MAG: heavy-metal-associated domain-containing protein [Propionibacteriaceae bacterium]|nr:heavy-metal-associated domain-containing protein [Propionibacteriaceae bacterium]